MDDDIKKPGNMVLFKNCELTSHGRSKAIRSSSMNDSKIYERRYDRINRKPSDPSLVNISR